MNFKKTLLTLVASVLLTPAMALAHNGQDSDRDGIPDAKDRREWTHRDSPPRPQHRPGGRYELRTVQRWVDGREDRVFVAERCWVKEKPGRRHGNRHRRTKTICEPAHYESRWVPGHYVSTQQWVWVSRFG